MALLTANDNTTITSITDAQTALANQNATVIPPSKQQPTNLQVAQVKVNDPAPAAAAATRNIIAKGASVPAPPAAATPDQDWRFKLTLAPGAKYLYNAPEVADSTSHLLKPLSVSKGVIFPYSPQISMSYKANYEAPEIVHTNYKSYFYKNSQVDEIQVTADFTAQDVNEAKYMLAVMHFFKSITKMFYGQDINPRGGTPPPLCFLSGYGKHQFSNHPVLVSSFSYTLPNDVDYIRTEIVSAYQGISTPNIIPNAKTSTRGPNIFQQIRLKLSGLKAGAKPAAPVFSNTLSDPKNNVSYVPSKLQIQLTLLPIVTRGDISNKFSLNGTAPNYASGDLTEKGYW
jgi:hypothetical protein